MYFHHVAEDNVDDTDRGGGGKKDSDGEEKFESMATSNQIVLYGIRAE